jgi:hypothetical protein
MSFIVRFQSPGGASNFTGFFASVRANLLALVEQTERSIRDLLNAPPVPGLEDALTALVEGDLPPAQYRQLMDGFVNDVLKLARQAVSSLDSKYAIYLPHTIAGQS